MKALLPALIIVLLAGIVTGRAGHSRDATPERSTGGSAGSASGEAGGEAGGQAAPNVALPQEAPRWLIDSSCTVMPDPPARDRSADRIVGSAHYRCDRPGADIDVTLYLQKRAANGTWTTVASRLISEHGKDTTRDRSEKQRTRSVNGPCADGAYRTFLRGTTTIRGRTQQVEKASSTVTDPCKSARR